MAASHKHASAPKARLVRKKKKHVFLRKIGAGVCLLALGVMLFSGLLAGVPLVTTAFRACGAIVVVLVIEWVLLSVLSTYEDMDRGKA
jgi:hypothetical protein